MIQGFYALFTTAGQLAAQADRIQPVTPLSKRVAAASMSPRRPMDLEEQWRGKMQFVHCKERALDDDRFMFFSGRFAQYGGPTILSTEVLGRMPDNDGNIVPPIAFLAGVRRY